ncbi:uncharacterized protein LOC115209391 isoform X2 [Octopus sinensis]|uniref:Uncharacterized protein LOC115209391 isoform X2 n=1 Tax=Octopus sinensis TaxID=2607531 RepID=A0A7E6EP36_9MOLL|nr:uncharacterized protein LOC115209391 isoform X2 [Octopus sinensis]
MSGRELELSQSEYSELMPYQKYFSNLPSTVAPFYNMAYDEQTNVPDFRHQESSVHYQHTTPNKNEELMIQNTILRKIEAYKNSGQLDGAWALITYGEFNRPITDICVRRNEYVIDNSNNEEEQCKIGLRSIPQCQAEILFNQNLQVILTQDEKGSIYLINNSNFSVFIKDYLDMKQPYFSQEVIEQRGVIFGQGKPIKIFDMEEFRSEMTLQIYHKQFNREQLKFLCKTNVLFADAQRCMESPSWIMVTNLQAMDLLFDDQVYSELEELIANFIAGGTQRKIKNKRKTFKRRIYTSQKESDLKRKTRMSLAKKGYKVKDFMKYSWENEDVVSPEDALNTNQMEEFFEPQKDYLFDFETDDTEHKHAKLVGDKMWARVKYTLENMSNENM